MSNRAFASVWCSGYSAETMVRLFGDVLATVPFAEPRRGITSLVIRAVDPAEPPLAEHDLRSGPLEPDGVIELVGQQAGSDTAIEARARWDLWVYDVAASKLEQQAVALDLCCYGTQYDGGICADEGHFRADVGFEHLFIGHAGLLGDGLAVAPEHPTEMEFLRAMAAPARLAEYREKTRENIRKLRDWLRAVGHALPVERITLWSEGEEDFASQLDKVLPEG